MTPPGEKLALALRHAVGRTLDRILVVERPGHEWQLFLFFTDGTSYELYGDGFMSGARGLDHQAPEHVRGRILRSARGGTTITELAMGAAPAVASVPAVWR